MADAQRLENLSQSAREALVNSLKAKASTDTTTYVDVTGDTMTGTLEVPSEVNTGAATIAGPATFVNEARMGGLALTSLASITGSLNLSGSLNSTGTVTATGVINLNSNATLANPMTLGFGSLLGGPTIAPLVVIASGASQSILDFKAALISTASINLAANKTIGFLKVQLNNVSGYMPVFIGVTS